MVLAISLVVVRRASHFALDYDDQFVPDLQFFGPFHEVVDPVEELGDKFHLIPVVLGMAVELADR